jgi:uncharacterized protein (TIGR03435 family)
MTKRVRIEEAVVLGAEGNGRRKTLLGAWVCAVAWMAWAVPAAVAQGGAALSASAAAAAHVFDVATIKPYQPDPKQDPRMGVRSGVGDTPDGIDARAATVVMLVNYAYGMRLPDQVDGGPDWAKKERFDVVAKMSAEDAAAMPTLSAAEGKALRQQMVRALLADRFGLKTHSEMRPTPVYELVVAKGGAKLQDTATDTAPMKLDKSGKPISLVHETGPNTSVLQNYSMKDFADYLLIAMHSLGRPVVDKTGLTGNYNFTLDWSIYSASARPSAPGVASDPRDDGDFLREALKKVGLGLQPANDGIEYIVIDQVERPTAN